MIEITRLDSAGLRQYIASEEFENAPVIAISKHRALSQLHNPRANPKDTLLLLARIDNRLVGYLGVLPDLMFTDHGREIRCGWMSCLWVDPAQRGKKIAQKLISDCFAAWDGKILLTEFTAAAGSLYHKTGLFAGLRALEGRRWYIRADLNRILSPKKEVFRRLSPLLKTLDASINLVLDTLRPLKPVRTSLTFRYVTHVPEEAADMIRRTSAGELFGRQPDDINWILAHPWILTRQWLDNTVERYHFSSFEKSLECRAILTTAYESPTVFMVYTFRNGHLRIPYIYGSNDDDALHTVKYLVSQLKVRTLTVYNQNIIHLLMENGWNLAHSRIVERHYLISRTLHQEAGDINRFGIQDGDGDCAFT